MPRTPPDPRIDQTLAQAAEGDQGAWRRLVDRYSPRVFALVVRQCADRDLAEEVTQATFVKVVVSIDGYRERGRFESWLFRIAMNHLRDEMRRRKRQAVPLAMTGTDGDAFRDEREDADPFRHASRAEQIALVQAAMDRMGEADRQILALRHTAGLSFAQIAETLGEPLGTVLSRAHRALRKLRTMMEEGPAANEQAAAKRKRAAGGT